MKSYFVKNEDNYIHVLESGNPQEGVPSLLVIGGIWESAERAIPIHNIKRHVISFSFRGRGLSSTPISGYDLEGHLSDIRSVVQACKLSNYCVLGFSRGAAYTLGWYLRKETEISGLILVDQAPVHRRIPPKSLSYWCNMIYQNVPVINHMRTIAFEGLSHDAVEYDFIDELENIKVPVKIFYGSNEHAEIPSGLLIGTRETYSERIEKVSFVEFSQSGHMIPDDETEKYVAEIDRFLDTLTLERCENLK